VDTDSAAAPRRRVAVIGGTGWIGRHACAAFAAAGYRVLVLARTPADPPAGHEFHRLDLGAVAPADLAELLAEAGVDAVVNTADATNTTDGWARTDAELEHYNVVAVRRLTEAVAALPGRPRLVHLGSIHEYGPVARGTRVHEAVPTRPVGAYAHSKLAGSRAVLDAAAAGRVAGVVLRPVNVCGPHPAPDTFPGKLLRLFDTAARTGGRVPVTIADAVRDWVDVRDVAAAVVCASTAPDAAGAYNIGSGTAVPMREFIGLLAAVAGLGPDRIEERGPAPAGTTGRWIQADVTAAARDLGWRPRTGLRTSLADMWAARG
jgi:nucleoside-diphosphate-sugar epimerase